MWQTIPATRCIRGLTMERLAAKGKGRIPPFPAPDCEDFVHAGEREQTHINIIKDNKTPRKPLM